MEQTSLRQETPDRREATAIDYILQMRERLVVIETKLDHYNETRQAAFRAISLGERNELAINDLKVQQAENRATAETAKTVAENGREDISEIKDSLRWTTRTSIVLMAGLAINIILNFVTG